MRGCVPELGWNMTTQARMDLFPWLPQREVAEMNRFVVVVVAVRVGPLLVRVDPKGVLVERVVVELLWRCHTTRRVQGNNTARQQ